MVVPLYPMETPEEKKRLMTAVTDSDCRSTDEDARGEEEAHSRCDCGLRRRLGLFLLYPRLWGGQRVERIPVQSRVKSLC